jgi:hypothetical protein
MLKTLATGVYSLYEVVVHVEYVTENQGAEKR